MPENFIPLHTEVERIASGNITQGDVLDYQERKGLVSPYEVNQMQVTGNSYDDYDSMLQTLDAAMMFGVGTLTEK